MQVEFNKEVFKAKARRQHEELKRRGISLKLCDVMESMAVALDHRNLAHLYGMFEAENSRHVPGAEIAGWSRWVMNQDTSEIGDRWTLLPEGTTLDDVASHDWKAVRLLLDSAVEFPEGFVLSEKTTALETYVQSPAIDRYGMPMPADRHRVDQWVDEVMGFRVIDTGVETSAYDRGDDGAEEVYVLIAINDEDAQRVRSKLFGRI